MLLSVASRAGASKRARKRSDLLETLTPDIRKRVEILREIQIRHNTVKADFLVKRAEIVAEFQKMCEPLYLRVYYLIYMKGSIILRKKRLSSVNCKWCLFNWLQRYSIVNGVSEVDGDGVTNEVEADKNAEVKKGVPDFWLNAMKTNEVPSEKITKRDDDPLKYLKEIKWCTIDTPKGFKLDFCFHTNPYFHNSILTKTYLMMDDDKPILEGVTGSIIRDKIIPHAVLWFTGEAAHPEYINDNDMDVEVEDDEIEDQKDEILQKDIQAYLTKTTSRAKEFPRVKRDFPSLFAQILLFCSCSHYHYHNKIACQRLFRIRSNVLEILTTNVRKRVEALLKIQITKRDEYPLKYLKDISWCRIHTPVGFQLDFQFHAENPYFKNLVLTKTYHLIDDVELILEEVKGTGIEWNLEKNLTQLGSSACKSFFNFIESEYGQCTTPEQSKELHNKMDHDYCIG
ncbi:hypothetical protein MKX03_001534 [Papaver bracteatum]|nr:hypothetical protein MKX03_001534 [Papaver bracteatum]